MILECQSEAYSEPCQISKQFLVYKYQTLTSILKAFKQSMCKLKIKSILGHIVCLWNKSAKALQEEK